MTVSYDLDRIHLLARRVQEVIEILDANRFFRSAGHAEVNARVRMTITRQHLVDDWMPLITDIVNTDAALAWNDQPLPRNRRLPEQLRSLTPTPPGNEFVALTDIQLLTTLLGDAADLQIAFAWDPDVPNPYWDTFPALIAALSDRLDDPDFVDLLIAHPEVLGLVLLGIDLGDFPVPIIERFAVAMLHEQHADWGRLDSVEQTGLELAMEHLMRHAPGTVLDVLGDRGALEALATWDTLDADVVQRFVRTGLHTAVANGSRSIDDGLFVMADIIDLANGSLDDGFGPGFARGLAESLFGYAPSLTGWVDGRLDDGRGHVLVRPDGTPVQPIHALGDLRDLFGALLRDRTAATTLGMVLGAYTDQTVTLLGDRRDSVRFRGPIVFGWLLDGAALDEASEIEMAEAATQARRQRLGDAIGFVAGVGIGNLALPRVVAAVAKEVAKRTPSALARRGGRRGSDGADDQAPKLVGAAAVTGLADGVLADAAQNSDRRAAYGVDDVSDADFAQLAELLDAISRASTRDDEAVARAHLTRFLDAGPASLRALTDSVLALHGAELVIASSADLDDD